MDTTSPKSKIPKPWYISPCFAHSAMQEAKNALIPKAHILTLSWAKVDLRSIAAGRAPELQGPNGSWKSHVVSVIVPYIAYAYTHTYIYMYTCMYAWIAYAYVCPIYIDICIMHKGLKY